MFERLIRFAIEQRWLVLLAVVAMAAIGVFSYQKLPIDAVPDITNVQVQINTHAAGYSPLETEQRITFPIETAMAGLPNLEQTRSLSRYGLSQVTVIFKDGTDIYFARQLVNERIQEARGKIPDGISPAMGPISTGLGEIYLWTVEAKDGAKKADGSPYTATDLREIQDWIIKPQLRNVPGVTEINSIGGFAKEYQVAPIPERLASLGVTMPDIVNALGRNNANVGAGYIEKRGEQYLIRAPGQVQSLEDIRNVILSSSSGVPIRVRDVADVGIGRELRTGAATENGREVVLGTVFMLIGQNSRTVSQAVDKKMVEINRSLPDGVHAVTVYDRTTLVDKAIATVKTNLLEGAILVIAILFLFLGNIRAAIITATVIPLSMLFTFTGMVTYKVSANLMSLGALDFGIIIDGAVVIVENCVRRLSHAQALFGRPLTRSERFHEVFLASKESRRALLFGQLIIMVVYLPIFALSGVEGKMFHPMAFTVVAALLGAMILSVTFVPAAVALFIGNRVSEKENPLMAIAKRWYAPMLDYAMSARAVVLTAVAVTVLLCGLIATRLGSEFVPNLNEGDFAIQALRIPGTSLTQSVAMQQQLESKLKAKFPEIERVFARTGTAEIASDPMPPNISDGYIMLKPLKDWPEPRKTRDELLAAVQKTVGEMPGNNYEFTQPIQMRFNELMTGARQDVVCKIYGDDLDTLARYAQHLGALVKQIDGARNLYVESVSGLPQIVVRFKRNMLAQYRVSIDEVNRVMHASLAGELSGQVYEGDQRFDIVVKIRQEDKQDLDAIRRLLVPVSGDQQVPLSMLADVNIEEGPNQIQRENARRRIVVGFNVRSRDVQSVVHDLQQKATQQLKLPSGYLLTYGGSFENLEAAKKRLLIAVPVSLLLIFLLLYFAFRSFRQGLLIYSAIPLSAIGGILFLALRGMPFSISAGVGFIALFGVAVLNGIVLIAEFNQIRASGVEDLRRVVLMGTKVRLRPVLMTAMVASMGFIPMALSNGAGAEVQRPLATVVIGGLLIATGLTLFVLPILYMLFEAKQSTKMKMPATSFLLIPALLLSGWATGQSNAIPLSLKAAQDSAVKQAWAMRTANNQVRFRQLLQKTAGQLPATSILGEAGEINSRYVDSRFTVSQSFDLPVTYKRKRALLNAEYNLATNEQTITAAQLVQQVSLLYIQYHYRQRQLQQEQHYDSLYQALSRQAEDRLKAGETDATETIYLGNMLLQHQRRIRVLQTDMMNLIEDWNWLLQTRQLVVPGNWQEADWVLNDTISANEPPQLQQYRQQIQLAEAQVQVERNGLLPAIQIGYSNGTMKGTGADEKKYSASDRFQFAQAGLTIPLFNKATRNRIAAARQAVQQANEQYLAAQSAWKKETRNWQRQYEQAQADWKLAATVGQRQTRELEQHIRLRREKGDITFIEWAQYMNQVIQWDEAYLEADYTRQKCLIQYQYYLNSNTIN